MVLIEFGAVFFLFLGNNHPSGDPSPSNDDISVTTRIKESGKILGILKIIEINSIYNKTL